MKTDVIFKIVAAALVAAAAVFLWMQNRDGAFAAGILAACAFFLGMRFEIKARMDRRLQEEQRRRRAEDEQNRWHE